ncbi:hypothetical protein IK110_03990 [Candidatus Saccharibacteria bacterium]|nr:hypothetical protein [Candidatus Saccharibacteria bacterium]
MRDIEDTAENRLDQLIAAIQDTVTFGSGTIAHFYRINPCFDLMDEHFEIVVYRDEYIKNNPEVVGLSEKEAAKLEGPTPEAFAVAMHALIRELSYFCDFEEDVIMDISDVDENGKILPIAHASGRRINPVDYDDECEGYEYDDDGINKEEDDEL